MLMSALAAGFASAGVEVDLVGVAPTPVASFLVRDRSYGIGGVVSASHNPAPDNGIKFFGPDGAKISESGESAITKGLGNAELAPTVGQIRTAPDLVDSYVDFLLSLVPERLDGMKIAVDGAHGAAFDLAPSVLRRLGAEVTVTGVSPDGSNINSDGGATKPHTICGLTAQSKCDVGVAFDGDADRAVFADGKGKLINGDQTIGIWSAYAAERGELDPPVVVGTVMTNGGFERFLASRGVRLVRTAVGDKYVSRELDEQRGQVGGEQSGHIIFPGRGPTGDGLVTALEFFRVLKRSGKSATEWSGAYEPWPQLLTNFTVPDPKGWASNASVKASVDDAERKLGSLGRVNVRPSGTQPILRVMVEAETEGLRDEIANRIESAILTELDGTVSSKVDLTHALGD
jgi:phosphoglucosamine mutase